jgi:predicted helicase
LTDGVSTNFEAFLSIANDSRAGNSQDAIFAERSLGLNSNRDTWVYNFSQEQLEISVTTLSAFYNAELRRWHGTPTNARGALDGFLQTEESKIKWSSRLKEHLLAANEATFQTPHIRSAVYRPFSKQFLYFDRILNHRRGRLPRFFPSENTGNMVFSVTDMGGRSEFSILASAVVPDLHLCASIDGFQCFSFYTYDEDGSNRRENITDWAFGEFRKHYDDAAITKWDIFRYIYALLHSSEYRGRYAANLKRDLPCIPYAPDFHAFATAGKRLAELHINYERQPECPLERIETPNAKLSFAVEKMRLGKDKSSLFYNDFLTLAGIPPETYEYRLGNRSALEWVIDQYQVYTDKRSGITNDPNREDDPEYILRLIGQVVYVSLETVKIVKALPGLGLPEDAMHASDD